MLGWALTFLVIALIAAVFGSLNLSLFVEGRSGPKT
jgi:uncharacterized membrane protein YtjA (UPF0391 family)